MNGLSPSLLKAWATTARRCHRVLSYDEVFFHLRSLANSARKTQAGSVLESAAQVSEKYEAAERAATQQTVVGEVGELDGHAQNRLTEAHIGLRDGLPKG